MLPKAHLLAYDVQCQLYCTVGPKLWGRLRRRVVPTHARFLATGELPHGTQSGGQFHAGEDGPHRPGPGSSLPIISGIRKLGRGSSRHRRALGDWALRSRAGRSGRGRPIFRRAPAEDGGGGGRGGQTGQQGRGVLWGGNLDLCGERHVCLTIVCFAGAGWGSSRKWRNRPRSSKACKPGREM